MDADAARKVHDDLLAAQPEGARHPADQCPFCVEKASQSTASGSLPAPAGPDVSHQQKTEGGNTRMADISMEAHDAMVKKAVDDALAASDAALRTKTEEANAATVKVTELETANAGLKTDNERLNKELDEAQVKLKAAEDRAKEAEDKLKKSEEDAALAEVASKRVEQVKGLGLFPEEFISERAERWSKQSDEDWAAQIAEWQQLKPASTEETPGGDTASALTGTTQTGLTTETPKQDSAAAGDGDTPKPRRLALGLR